MKHVYDSMFLPRLLAVVEPQRPLRPKRVERKKVSPQNIQPGDVKILINIVRAFGIPVREQMYVTHASIVFYSTLNYFS